MGYFDADGNLLHSGVGYQVADGFMPNYAPTTADLPPSVGIATTTRIPQSVSRLSDDIVNHTLDYDPASLDETTISSAADDFALMRQRIVSVDMTPECRTRASAAIDKLEIGGGTPAAWATLTAEDAWMLMDLNMGHCPDGCAPFPWLWVGIGAACVLGLVIYYNKTKRKG